MPTVNIMSLLMPIVNFGEQVIRELWKPQTNRPTDSVAELDTGALTTAPINEKLEGGRKFPGENRQLSSNYV